MKRLIMVRHAPTAATRAASFPAEEGIEVRARVQAAGLRRLLSRRAQIVSSSARCCLETAAAAGLEPTTVSALADLDLGAWAGRSLAEVGEADPEGASAWRRDPDARPHGGESLTAFAARVSGWLDSSAAEDGSTVAVTHAAVIRTAVVAALSAPIEAWWRVDVAPLSLTELHSRGGRWTVTKLSAPIATST